MGRHNLLSLLLCRFGYTCQKPDVLWILCCLCCHWCPWNLHAEGWSKNEWSWLEWANDCRLWLQWTRHEWLSWCSLRILWQSFCWKAGRSEPTWGHLPISWYPAKAQLPIWSVSLQQWCLCQDPYGRLQLQRGQTDATGEMFLLLQVLPKPKWHHWKQ